VVIVFADLTEGGLPVAPCFVSEIVAKIVHCFGSQVPWHVPRSKRNRGKNIKMSKQHAETKMHSGNEDNRTVPRRHATPKGASWVAQGFSAKCRPFLILISTVVFGFWILVCCLHCGCPSSKCPQQGGYPGFLAEITINL